jgi:6-phosphogluconolactonase
LYSAVFVLLASQQVSVTAQAPTEAPAQAAIDASTTSTGDCSSVLLAVGSYNDISWIIPKGTGEGVSIMNLELCGTAEALTANLTTELLIGVVDTGSNPGYCDQFDASTILCANEVPMGSVALLDLSSDAGPQSYSVNSSNPVYVELLSNGLVATANYGGSSFTILDPKIDPSRAVIQTVEFPLDAATMEAGNLDRQEAPHPHMVTEVAEGELLVTDLGSDAVYQYRVAEDGKLMWEGQTNTTAADGPRHIAVGKMGKVYVLAELSKKILELDSTCKKGAVGSARGICAEKEIPPPIDGTVFLTGAALRVSKNQEYVYASLRRAENVNAAGGIVGYKVEANGSIGEVIGLWASGGGQPRDFNLVDVPGFKEVFVVANLKTSTVDVFDRDEATGELGDLLVSADVKSPTSILPLANITSADLDGSGFTPVISNASSLAEGPASGVDDLPGDRGLNLDGGSATLTGGAEEAPSKAPGRHYFGAALAAVITTVVGVVV